LAKSYHFPWLKVIHFFGSNSSIPLVKSYQRHQKKKKELYSKFYYGGKSGPDTRS
jgi:hypothetical protein